jgi:hypothetical protein
MTRGSGRGEAKVGAALDAVESGRGVGAFYRAAEGRGETGMQRGTAAIRCNFKASVSEGGEMGWHQLQEGKRRKHRSDSVPMRRRWLEGSGYGSVKPTGGGSLQTGGGRRRRCGPDGPDGPHRLGSLGQSKRPKRCWAGAVWGEERRRAASWIGPKAILGCPEKMKMFLKYFGCRVEFETKV